MTPPWPREPFRSINDSTVKGVSNKSVPSGNNVGTVKDMAGNPHVD